MALKPGFWREHAVALTVSIVLHVGLAAAIVYGWWQWHNRPQPPQPLPIQATVVDEAAIKRETAKLEAAAQAEKNRQAEVKREADEEAAKLEELKQQREAAEQAAREDSERKQAEAEAQAQAKAKADAAADAKRKQDVTKLAADKKRKTEEAKQRAAREAELKHQLEAEEQRQAAVSSGALADYLAQIQARIQRVWNRPPSAVAGLDCTVYITQVPGGTISSARLGECNGDQATRESILAAVYRASPLPAPSNPDLFDRNLKVPFRPEP
ncbi:MAG TPA: cell envelope integrity protein TolA [Steroidobacteraceae bacterium]|nr:cell envelope integrity protein TolA [Steroidobacteraceae bacterium]